MTEDRPYPRMYADDRGIWREDKPGHPYGLEWKEVCRIVGYKIEGFEEVSMVLELDLVFGEFLELNSSWSGFGQVVEAIIDRLGEATRERFQELDALSEDDDTIVIYKKA